jgi:hypothetical protein
MVCMDLFLLLPYFHLLSSVLVYGFQVEISDATPFSKSSLSRISNAESGATDTMSLLDC